MREKRYSENIDGGTTRTTKETLTKRKELKQ